MSTFERALGARLADNSALLNAVAQLSAHTRRISGIIPKPLTDFTERVALGLVKFPNLDAIRDEVTQDPHALIRFVTAAWRESGLPKLARSYSYADLELEAGHSAGTYQGDPSRKGVDLTSRIAWNRHTNQALMARIPFIPANMRTVMDPLAAETLIELGGLPILRWINSEGGRAERLAAAERLGGKTFVTIRSSEKEVALGLELLRLGAGGLCLEMANAFTPSAFRAIRAIKDAFPDCFLICGNIVTPQGYLFAALAGADMVKAGRGSGAACTTPRETGMGARQLTACLNIAYAQLFLLLMSNGKIDVPFNSDGGMSTSGDAVKAAFAGAESFMLGSYFAAVDESPAQKFRLPDKRVLVKYSGEAGFEAAQADGHGTRGVKPQGESGLIPSRGPMKGAVQDLGSGLQAGIADGNGVASLTGFVNSASDLIFQEMTPLGSKESNTRFTAKTSDEDWQEIQTAR